MVDESTGKGGSAQGVSSAMDGLVVSVARLHAQLIKLEATQVEMEALVERLRRVPGLAPLA